MLFNSIEYLIFFPIVVGIYFLLSFKYRWIWLLLASYFFYMSWNSKYALLMGTSTVITYLSGILIDKDNEIEEKNKRVRRKKLWVFLSFASNLFILFFFKYFNFFNENLIYLFEKFNMNWKIPNFNILLPVGISFYTFQALSYTVDVYRGDIKAQKNLGKYALFVSFFPQLVAGPIERSTHLLVQLDRKFQFDYERIKYALLLILWGLFKKIVIADRLAIVVNTVYNQPEKYQGLVLVIASIFFAFQIYCDFSAYSDMAIGSARVMGYDLMENFNNPYFSSSINEFWKRWHISLSTWFRDYLYIPLGGSRVGKLKKYFNILFVFFVSGLWHGANWTFIFWGILHGIYQVISYELKPMQNFICSKLKINKETYGYRLYRIIFTFVLIDFAWIFFRANTFKDAKYIVKNLKVFNPEVLIDGTLYKLGLDTKDFKISIFMILFLIFSDYIRKRYNLNELLRKRNIVIRLFVYYFSIFFIIVFGFYGTKYDASQFIYFQF